MFLQCSEQKMSVKSPNTFLCKIFKVEEEILKHLHLKARFQSSASISGEKRWAGFQATRWVPAMSFDHFTDCNSVPDSSTDRLYPGLDVSSLLPVS